MRILLFGSGGFIGSHFAQALAGRDGLDLFSPKRSEVDLRDQDAVAQAIREFSPEVVVNCAVVVQSLDESLQSLFNIVRAIPSQTLYFQVGSGAEYGRASCPPDVDETYFGSSLPEDKYGMFKYLSALTLDNYLPGRFINLRTFGVFGLGEESRRLIPSLVMGARDNGRAQLRSDGDFSFVPVNDLARFLIGWIENGCAQRGHYNFSGVRPIRLGLVLGRIQEAFPDAVCEVIERGTAHPYFGNSRKLIETAPWFQFSDIWTEIDYYINAIK